MGDVPTRSYAAGDVIFREGDEATGEAYLVHEGRLEIRKQFGSEERVLRVVGKGELLGELALFRNAPRSATAVAAEPAVLIVIPSSRLDALVRTNPTLALALIKQLATRMLEAEDRAAQMAALLERNTAAPPR
jgi:CRP/FNR family cyclic AMP-dependent transcriptional regulator